MRSKALAVSAPGSVELDQDLLLGVEDHLFEVLADDDLDGLIVGFGDGGGLEEGLELAVGDLGDKAGEVLGSDLSGFVFEFLRIAVEEEDLRGVLGVDSEVLGESIEQAMSVILGGECEDDLRGGLIKGLEGIKGSSLSSLVPKEEEDCRLLLLEDLVNGGVVEGDDFCVEDNQKEGQG